MLLAGSVGLRLRRIFFGTGAGTGARERLGLEDATEGDEGEEQGRLQFAGFHKQTVLQQGRDSGCSPALAPAAAIIFGLFPPLPAPLAAAALALLSTSSTLGMTVFGVLYSSSARSPYWVQGVSWYRQEGEDSL